MPHQRLLFDAIRSGDEKRFAAELTEWSSRALTRLRENGFSLVTLAASLGHSKMLELLADHRVSLVAADDNENTAAHLAAMNGHVAVFPALVKHGSPLSAFNRHRLTPAHLAARNGHAAVLLFLADMGCLCARSIGTVGLPSRS